MTQLKQSKGVDILRLSGASIGYQHALTAPLSLTIMQGDRLALHGPNGIGKSLLLKALAKQACVFSGELWHAPDLSLMLLAQENARNSMPPISGFDWFEALQIEPPPFEYLVSLLSQRLDQLSGGQFQLVRLASALTPPKCAAHHPHLILLDEPANHLDKRVKGHAIELITALPAHVTLLMTGHDTAMIDASGARQITMEQCFNVS